MSLRRDIFWGEALKMGLVRRCSSSRKGGAGPASHSRSGERFENRTLSRSIAAVRVSGTHRDVMLSMEDAAAARTD